MKTVIIVSKCLRVTKFGPKESSYEFHFRGVCAGEIVQKIILSGCAPITKGIEYLISVQVFSIEAGVLKGSMLKAKRLDECFDKS